MLLLGIVSIWLGLAALTGALFVAVIRGGGGTGSAEEVEVLQAVDLPAQRVPGSQPVSQPAAAAP